MVWDRVGTGAKGDGIRPRGAVRAGACAWLVAFCWAGLAVTVSLDDAGQPAVRSAHAQFNPRGRRKPSSQKPGDKSQAAKGATESGTAQPKPKSSSDKGRTTAAERYYLTLLKLPMEKALFERWWSTISEGGATLTSWTERLRTDSQLADKQRSYGAALVLGRVLYRTGDADGARRALEAAQASSPGEPQAYLLEAELLSGGVDAERSLLQTALETVNNAGKVEILRRLARVCLEQDDVEAARRHYRDLGQRSRAMVKVGREFAQELEGRGQQDEAAIELVWLSQQEGLSDREQAELLFELGRLELSRGRPSEALGHLRQAERAALSDRRLWLEVLEAEFEAASQSGALHEFAENAARTSREDALLLSARAFDELGERARAEAILQKLRKRATGDRQIRLAYALFLEQSGRVAEAASEYTLALELDPKDEQLASRVVELWVGLGEVDKAKVILERLARTATTDREMRFVLDACDRVLSASSCERFEASFERSQDAELLYELGERKFDRQKVAEALALWKRASQLRQDSSGRLRSAELWLNHEQFELAFEAYAELAESGNMEVLRARALGLERIAGQADKDLSARAESAAVAAFRRLLAEAPRTAERAEAARHLVQLWHRADELQHEVRVFEARALRSPGDIEAWLVLSEAYAFKGEHELLRDALLQLKQASPGDSWAELRLLRAERGVGTERGPASAKRSSPVEYSLELAALLKRSGQFQRAAEVLTEALKSATGSVELHFELGQLLMLLGDNHRALGHLRLAYAEEPSRRDVLLALAEISLSLSDLAAARGFFFRVLRADPRSDEVSRAVVGQMRAIEAAGDSSSAAWAAELESELLALFRAHPGDVAFAEPLVGFYEWTFGDNAQSLSARGRLTSIQRRRFVDHSLSPLSVVLAKGKGSSETRTVRLLAEGGAELAAPILLHYATSAGSPLERAEAMLALEKTDHAPSWRKLASLLQEPEALSAEVAWCGLYVLIGAKISDGIPLPLQLLDSSRPELRTLTYLGMARRGEKVSSLPKSEAGKFESFAFALAEAYSGDRQAAQRLLTAAEAQSSGQGGPFVLGLALAARKRGSSFLELPGATELASRELLEGGGGDNLALLALDPRSLAHIEEALHNWKNAEINPRGDLTRDLEKALWGSPPSQLPAPVFETLLGAYAAHLKLILDAGGASARRRLELLDPGTSDPRRPPTPELRQAVWRLIRWHHYRLMSADTSAWPEALRSLPSEELHARDYQTLLLRALKASRDEASSSLEATERELVVARLLAEKNAPPELLAAAVQSEANPLVRKRLNDLLILADARPAPKKDGSEGAAPERPRPSSR